ncbi:hypothetical protein VNI00_002516 [Paramarasmius palmivorus]|uniref:Uncharacterized protein n=1 Tax=Paramarasmius palmivorus TaxID=297713 RepID=A0AAW0DV93_9AGAR
MSSSLEEIFTSASSVFAAFQEFSVLMQDALRREAFYLNTSGVRQGTNESFHEKAASVARGFEDLLEKLLSAGAGLRHEISEREAEVQEKERRALVAEQQLARIAAMFGQTSPTQLRGVPRDGSTFEHQPHTTPSSTDSDWFSTAESCGQNCGSIYGDSTTTSSTVEADMYNGGDSRILSAVLRIEWEARVLARTWGLRRHQTRTLQAEKEALERLNADLKERTEKQEWRIKEMKRLAQHADHFVDDVLRNVMNVDQ